MSQVISRKAEWNEEIYSGEFDVYTSPNHQPGFGNISYQSIIDTSLINYNYEILQQYTAPKTVISYPEFVNINDKFANPTETTYVYIYSLVDYFNYSNSQSILFDQYIGSLDFYRVPIGQQLVLSQSGYLEIYNGINKAIYIYTKISEYISKQNYYYRLNLSVASQEVVKPNYRDLITGYYLDDRAIPEYPEIIPTKTEVITIKYYQNNPYEPIPNLKTIEWREYTVNLTKGKSVKLPIYLLTLGTLQINSEAVKSLIINLSLSSNFYGWDNAFESAISQLFAHWNNLYNTRLTENLVLTYPTNALVTQEIEVGRTLRRISANNNYWNQTKIDELDNDFNPIANHSMFSVNTSRTYNWHFQPQSDSRGTGTLTMDSPRIIEIHASLGATKWAVDPDDATKQRIWNLGEQINAIARVLGLRRKADGKIDRDREQSVFLRKTLNNPKYNRDAYFTNGFGDYGYVLPHLTNQFKDKPYDVVYDIPQMLLALHEHVNRSLGIQQGTNLEIKNSVNGSIDRYPNQLALNLDLISKVTEINQNAKETFNLVNVAAQEQRELFSGIGIPITHKTLYNRYGSFGYLGHQSDKGSINTGLTTIKANVGMILGEHLQKPIDKNNPLHNFLFAKKDKVDPL